jgi:hypothetical protein
VCVSLVLLGLLAAGAGAAKPSLLLTTFTSHEALTSSMALELRTIGAEVRTKNGSSSCRGLDTPATDVVNGSAEDRLELAKPNSKPDSCTSGAPFGWSSLEWVWSNFPFNHGFGEIVLKPHGKSTTEGKAELLPSASTSDLFAFGTTEAGIRRECSYSFKKLKGTWSGGRGEGFTLSFAGNKLKSAGSDDDPSCPKTVDVTALGVNSFAIRETLLENIEATIV